MYKMQLAVDREIADHVETRKELYAERAKNEKELPAAIEKIKWLGERVLAEQDGELGLGYADVLGANLRSEQSIMKCGSACVRACLCACWGVRGQARMIFFCNLPSPHLLYAPPAERLHILF